MTRTKNYACENCIVVDVIMRHNTKRKNSIRNGDNK